MEEAIKNIATQFNFVPSIENESKFVPNDKVVLCGMGGSHLSAGLLKIYNPNLDIYIHRDYGLPILSEKRFKDALYIASSYSGNTEEVLDFAESAVKAKYNLVTMSIGGKLEEFAKKNTIPYIKMPDTGIQPRSAVGFSIISMAKFIEGDEAVAELNKLGAKLNAYKWEEQGINFSKILKGKVPVIYSSRTNQAIAYNWKIKFNETAKIPSFYNFFPELNHNEIAGFDVVDSTKDISKVFHFIFIEGSNDHPRILKRMEVCRELYEERGLGVISIVLTGNSIFEKIFNSLILADWTALHLARTYDIDPNKVAIVEEFKKLIT